MADSSAKSSLSRVPAPVLSFDGEYHAATEKRFEETIILIPFFGGKKSQLRRHIEFVSELGFDCVVFNLKFDFDLSIISAQSGFGFKHIWADQIEKILNEVPGQKILYAFSNPSASAIEATARRHATDIAGIVCDSGPSGKLWLSMIQYYKYEQPIHWSPLRYIAAIGSTLAWSPRFLQIIHQDLRTLPKDFPILSIRGWKDPLISPDQIDLVFEPHTQLQYTRLSLPKAAHLNGLKDFPEQYKPPVIKFLENIATRI